LGNRKIFFFWGGGIVGHRELQWDGAPHPIFSLFLTAFSPTHPEEVGSMARPASLLFQPLLQTYSWGGRSINLSHPGLLFPSIQLLQVNSEKLLATFENKQIFLSGLPKLSDLCQWELYSLLSRELPFYQTKSYCNISEEFEI
jgi:hypothetical protein